MKLSRPIIGVNRYSKIFQGFLIAALSLGLWLPSQTVNADTSVYDTPEVPYYELSLSTEIITLGDDVTVTATGYSPVGSPAINETSWVFGTSDMQGNPALRFLCAITFVPTGWGVDGRLISQGSCTFNSLTVGLYPLYETIYAYDHSFWRLGLDTYKGDFENLAELTVNPAPAEIEITSTLPDPLEIYQNYTVAVKVTSDVGDVSGKLVNIQNETSSYATDTHCQATLAADGTASCTIRSTKTGANITRATFGGGDYENSSAVINHTVVGKIPTVTILSDSPDPSTPGQSYTASVKVDGGIPYTLPPGGSAAVSDGAGGSCTIASLTLDYSTGTSSGNCNLSSSSPGLKTLTATYTPAVTEVVFGSGSGTTTHTVSKVTPTVTITSDSPDPSNPGQNYAVNVSVSGSYGTPSGTVSVSDGTGVSCNITLSGGSGSCNLSSVIHGDRTLTASYSGDNTYLTASDTETHTIRDPNPTVTFTTNTPNPSYVNQDYTIGITVTGYLGTPTGTVSVSDGTGDSCTINLVNGSGCCSLNATTTGTRTITATYNGDSTYLTGVKTTSHQITKAPPTVSFTSISHDPSYVNESYTVAVSVSGAMGTPIGSIMISDGSGETCMINELNAGSGNCSLSSSPHGAKILTAQYSGDNQYTTGSQTTSHQVNQRTPTVTITADEPDSSYIHENYDVSVSVSGTAETPSGTVDVSDGSGASCDITLSNGSGTCSLASTSIGSNTLNAAYSGDVVYTSENDTEAHAVIQYDSITNINSDDTDPSVVGETYTISVTVSSISPVKPSGEVTVNDGEGNTCEINLSNGSGSCDINATSAGAKTLTAAYSGDERHKTSNETEAHIVNIAPTSAEITSVNPATVRVKQSTTINFKVSSASPSTAIPTGEVTISDGEGNTCKDTLDASGEGSCSLNPSSVGVKTISLSYPVNANFEESNDTDSLTVEKAATSVTITSDLPDPSSSETTYTVNVEALLLLPSVGTPETDVTIDDGTGNECTVTFTAGKASCDFNTLTTGNIMITAKIAESSNYLSSNDTEAHFIATLPDDITLNEDHVSTIHTNVGTLSTNNGYQTYTYTLENSGDTCNALNGAGNTAFEIAADTGNLTATLQRNSDTTKGGYQICVQTTDALGARYQETFTIEVNDPPSDILLSDNTVAENESQVGILSNSDGLKPFTFTFETTGTICNAVNGKDNDHFTLTDTLLKPVSGLTAGDYAICIQVSDYFSDNLQETFNITVTAASVGDEYEFSSSGMSLIDGDGPDTIVGTLQTEGGEGPEFTLVDTGSYPDNAFFKIENGQIVFNGTTDQGTQGSFLIKVEVKRPDGTNHTNEILITRYHDGETAGGMAVTDQFSIMTGSMVRYDPELNDIHTSFAEEWAFYEIVEMPKNGTAELGSIIYRSKAGFVGEETLTYRICDKAGYCLMGTAVFVVEPLPLPDTGFAPNTITQLSVQSTAYQQTEFLLRIPKLDVEIPILGVPYSAAGWDVSWLDESAGWLDGTAFPTWTGNSVLTGHVMDANGKPGVFAQLVTLQYGDSIEIQFDERTFVYQVRSVNKVKPNSPEPLAHTPEGFDYLTLITCIDFDYETETYTHRLAVQAVLIAVH